MSDGKDSDARALILARRQFFIASALAGVAIAGCDGPQPCLDVAPVDPPTPDPAPPASSAAKPEPSVPPRPTVCLEMAPVPEPTAEPSATTGTAPKPAPRVCLKKAIPPKPSPKVCLKKLPPPTGEM